jgi:isopentenyl diphosphate isomerase/L-lactate dehydrogenase-like FMN-dependent dehydrogenase
VLETFAQGLKTAMICTGSRTLDDLAPRLSVTPEFLARAAGVVDGC